VNSGFRHELNENGSLLGYYAASSNNFSLTFRDNLSVPNPGVNNPECLTPEDGTDTWPKTSVRNYYFSLCNDPEERRSRRNFIALKKFLFSLRKFNFRTLKNSLYRNTKSIFNKVL
jgi:hypothetical protein